MNFPANSGRPSPWALPLPPTARSQATIRNAILLALVPALLATVVSSTSVAGESRTAGFGVRAIWVTRWDYQTERDVRGAIRAAAALGLNRVLFQVRGRADAFYPSQVEPWGEEIGGRHPGFDPLQVAIEEAAATGIELDAWLNVLPAWKGSKPPKNRQHVYYTHPEWFLVDRSGRRLLLDADKYTVLNPCLPQVRNYLVRIVEDIASRYRFDGLHLDYVRFVGRKPGTRHDFPYDANTLRLFENYSGGLPSTQPAEWNEWRRRSVNTVIYRLSNAYRALQPHGRVSVAAIKDYARARENFFQDVVTWQRRGWVDEVFPMTYDKTTSGFTTFASRALSVPQRDNVYPGVGVYLHDNARQLAAQLQQLERMNAKGYALFALSNFYPTPSHESRSDERSRALRASMRRAVANLNATGSGPTTTSIRASQRPRYAEGK